MALMALQEVTILVGPYPQLTEEEEGDEEGTR